MSGDVASSFSEGLKKGVPIKYHFMGERRSSVETELWALCLGQHTYYNGRDREQQHSDVKRNPKSGLSSD